MNDLILDDVPEQPTKLAVKIDFLQQEKENLEESVKELSENIKIYKQIIDKLMEGQGQQVLGRGELTANSIIRELNILNDRQITHIERLMEEVNGLKCTLLLKDQIMEEQDI